MATIFPREQKAKMLFEKIKENPQACERLMETFYDALGVGDDYEGNGLSAEQFATALFRSYEEKDLTAFLMAICQNSMFDLLRNSFLAPFRFNANGQTNPYILTDEDGKLIPDIKFHVSDKNYEQFFKVFQKSEQVKMYLAYGFRKRHCYDRDTMEAQEIRMGEHIGVLLVYEMPDTVKMQETEAQAYAIIWDILMDLQKSLPRSVVYYGQDSMENKGNRYDALGVFLPMYHFRKALEKNIDIANKIVELANKNSNLNYMYELEDDIKTKILKVSTKIYGAKDVIYSKEAEEQIEKKIKRMKKSY